jgi:NAD+ kinase
VSTVGILVRPDLGPAGPAVRGLVGWLQERGIAVCIDEHTAELVDMSAAKTCRVAARADVAAHADVLVVLGGDGTLLAAARLVERPVPVLGVNFGSLGFLTEITMPELYPTLEGVLAGDYRYEERRMLRAVVQQRGAADTTCDVLNDVVVTKAALSRIIELDVAVDGLFVSAFRADGLIVSSPTGSTAYNLAAGGPIIHPTLDAVVLTPICPHMLTNRPLVISDRSTIEVKLRAAREGEAHATLDGQRGYKLRDGDAVTVTRSPRTIRLVKAHRDYFEVLRTKLKWGESKQKA